MLFVFDELIAPPKQKAHVNINHKQSGSWACSGVIKKRGQIFSEMTSRVARERHAASGKILIPAFPLKIQSSNWKVSNFSYKNKTSQSIRILEPPFKIQTPKIRSFFPIFP